jgi:RNA polymerase sigma-70 factor (ECF subfamily)
MTGAKDEQQRAMDRFLASVERRSLVMAEIAVRDREEALDLVQDAMLAFVRRYSGHREGEWPPLFHRVLQNRIRDWHRRNKVRSRWRGWLSGGFRDEGDEIDPIQTAPDRPQVAPDQTTERHHASDALIAAVETLPLRQQQAFLLRTWEGLGVAETAQAMGCSDGSVKTHLSRALQSLRNQLEDHWP